jgi:hypothetical protein
MSSVGKGPMTSKLALRAIFGAALLIGSKVPLGMRELKRLDDYQSRYIKKR